MNNHKANVAVRVLSIFVVIVITSLLVLILVRTGIISVKAEYEPVDVLNTEFLPIRDSGTINLKEFSFCQSIDAEFNCLRKGEFTFGDEVHFKFVIESTVFQNQVMIVKNYRIKSPSGQLLLDANSKDNFYVDVQSDKETETIAFKDYFTLLGAGETGTYTLELIIENPLISKQTTLIETFEVVE